MTCQKIEVYEHQICKISLRILGQNIGDWLCYGSVIRKGYQECMHFKVEADTEKNLFNITIPAIDIKSPALKFELHEYQIFLKNIFTRQEFAVLTGDILVNKRTCIHDAEESISSTPIELEATVSGNILDVAVSIAGGLSAYEIAKLHGFSGTEEEWISELQGAADAANDAKQSRESAQESLTTTLQAQGKAQEEAQKSESLKNEALGYSQSAASSANNAQTFAETSQAAAEVAEQKRAEAEAAASAANSSKIAAEKYENNAKESKESAISSQLAAEQAKQDAQAAQSTAEEQARIATAAAEAAQAPESIAAQSARPATMLLIKDELQSILGDSSLFDLDTDGQKIIVHTDRLNDEQLAAVTDMLARFVPGFIEVVRYNHNMEISWRDINKYAECVTPMDMYEVSPETTNIKPNQFGAEYRTTDYCSDGTWAYPLPKLETTNCGGWNVCVFADAKVELLELHLPALLKWYGQCNVKRLRIYAPNVTLLTSAWNNLTEEFFITADNITTFAYDCRWNKLRHVDFGLPKLSDGDGAFHSAQLDKESCLLLLNSLPEHTTGTHKFMLGAHIDHQNDEEVLAAIAAAEAKGWELTVQWNPNGGEYVTPASTTYGLRKPPIYARVGEMERPDGTTERVLDWGHYVTDPTGYEEFRSVEAAREYYGLPEEPLINN